MATHRRPTHNVANIVGFQIFPKLVINSTVMNQVLTAAKDTSFHNLFHHTPFSRSLQALRIIRVQDLASVAASTLGRARVANTTTLSVVSLGCGGRASGAGRARGRRRCRATASGVGELAIDKSESLLAVLLAVTLVSGSVVSVAAVWV